jgi:hypothetical protein
VLNLLVGSAFKLAPMAILHELGVELGNEGQDSVHVLHALVKEHEGLPLADHLVSRSSRVALLGLHLLDKVGEVIGIDLLPSGFFPAIKLHIDEGNEIPHLLDGDKLAAAVFELLV